MDKDEAARRPFSVRVDFLTTHIHAFNELNQFRVLNTFKTMITDDQVLVEDDLYILDRIKEFLLDPEVSASPAGKTLLNIIERRVSLLSIHCERIHNFRIAPRWSEIFHHNATYYFPSSPDYT